MMGDQRGGCRNTSESCRGSRPVATWLPLLALCLALPSWGFATPGGRAGSEGYPTAATNGSTAGARGERSGKAPATVVEQSRDVTQTNDFLRVTFLPEGVNPTRLGGPNASWVFVGASAFYRPAFPVGEIVKFPGLNYEPDLNLIAMRCITSNPVMLEPTLATWPNVAEIIKADLSATYTCPPAGGLTGQARAENEVFCLARDFTDSPNATAVASIQRAVDLGVELFVVSGGDEVLRQRYGIFRAFGGLGLSIKGSGDGDQMLASEVLQQSITPEYLVRNATLAEGGCSCINVPPYAGREAALLDMDFILHGGGQGECRVVNRLD